MIDLICLDCGKPIGVSISVIEEIEVLCCKCNSKRSCIACCNWITEDELFCEECKINHGEK